jgi:hypothetical protein
MTPRYLGRRLIAATRVARWEARIEAATRRALARHRHEALTVLRAAAHPDPFDLAAWDGSIDEEVLPVVARVLREAADGTLNLFSLPPHVRSLVIGRLDVDAQAATFTERIRAIGPDVADRLRVSLSEGLTTGEGIPGLQARVGEVFGVGEHSAETIARTEVMGAANLAGHEAAGVVHQTMPLLKTWLSAGDDRTRDDHADADGQTVPYDEPFLVGGEELDYPLDPNGSAENTINCRCVPTYEEEGGAEVAAPEEAQLAE